MPATSGPPAALLPPAQLDALRVAVEGYTVAAVHELLGLAGQAAHDRGDLAGVRRAVRVSPAAASRTATLVRLFLLADAVDERDARAALHPLALDAAAGHGLVTVSAGSVRAALDLRPVGTPGGSDCWVVSDLGSDVRPGPLASDHVLGVGSASLTLAQATPRDAVGRALDVGTGCGVQALFLGEHAGAVTATDVSHRALGFAATSAALSGQQWHLRHGSLLEPVGGAEFDLVVANPPFVVSAGGAGHDYRDSGLAGDEVSSRLARSIPGLLAPGGTGLMLANWVITAEQAWDERVGGWLSGPGCDAWAWQREVADPGEYVALWLRDAGEVPGTARWSERYDAWLDWFAAHGVLGVGMGLIALFAAAGTPGGHDPIVVCEDVPQPLAVPIGGELPRWIARRRWLATHDDSALLAARLRTAGDLVLTVEQVLGSAPAPSARRVRQASGMRWEIEMDEAFIGLLTACDGTRPLSAPLALLAAAAGADVDAVSGAALPVVRDLVGRGLLEPPETRR